LQNRMIPLALTAFTFGNATLAGKACDPLRQLCAGNEIVASNSMLSQLHFRSVEQLERKPSSSSADSLPPSTREKMPLFPQTAEREERKLMERKLMDPVKVTWGNSSVGEKCIKADASCDWDAAGPGFIVHRMKSGPVCLQNIAQYGKGWNKSMEATCKQSDLESLDWSEGNWYWSDPGLYDWYWSDYYNWNQTDDYWNETDDYNWNESVDYNWTDDYNWKDEDLNWSDSNWTYGTWNWSGPGGYSWVQKVQKARKERRAQTARKKLNGLVKVTWGTSSEGEKCVQAKASCNWNSAGPGFIVHHKSDGSLCLQNIANYGKGWRKSMEATC